MAGFMILTGFDVCINYGIYEDDDPDGDEAIHP